MSQLVDYFRAMGTMETATGPQEVPFVCRQCTCNVLYGEFDRAFAEEALKEQGGLRPVTYTKKDGREVAAGSVWVMKYEDTTCGAYEEIVTTLFSVEAGDEEGATLAGAEEIPELLLQAVQRPGVTVYVDRLWLNERVPIAYGRDILGMDKHAMSSAIVAQGRDSVQVRATTGDDAAKLLLHVEYAHPTTGAGAVVLPAPAVPAPVVTYRLATPWHVTPPHITPKRGVCGRGLSQMAVPTESAFCRWEGLSGACFESCPIRIPFSPRLVYSSDNAHTVFFPTFYPTPKE